MSRGVWLRTPWSQPAPAAQDDALSSALSAARLGGRYASTARAFLPQLRRVEPSSELVWFAPEAVRAFLVTGRSSGAQPWFDLLSGAAGRDPKMARSLEQLMPVARLAGFAAADAWSTERLSDWWASVKDTEGARDKAAMLIATLDALGEYAPESMWVELINGPSHQSILAPNPATWFLLNRASSQARVGETVLLSWVSLSDGGPANAAPLIAHRVFKALRNVGLNDDVRAMALEAVVAAGL